MSRGHRRGAMRIDVSAIKEIFDHGDWPSAAAWFGCERLAVRLSSRQLRGFFVMPTLLRASAGRSAATNFCPKVGAFQAAQSHDRAAELPPPERGICIILTGFSGLLPA